MPDIASSLPGDHHEPRLRLLNDAAVRNSGQFVLYWMTGARRTTWNFALERAVAWMKEFQRPLVVLEALRVDYPWASARHHAFIIRGMAENQLRLAAKGVTSYAYVEPTPGAGRGLLQALAAKACVIVTDDAPIFFLGRMAEKSARKAPVRVEAIDGNGLVPVRLAEKQYLTAASFRRFLHMELPVHLADFPVEDPLRRVPAFKAPNLEQIKKKWPPMVVRHRVERADFRRSPAYVELQWSMARQSSAVEEFRWTCPASWQDAGVPGATVPIEAIDWNRHATRRRPITGRCFLPAT